VKTKSSHYHGQIQRWRTQRTLRAVWVAKRWEKIIEQRASRNAVLAQPWVAKRHCNCALDLERHRRGLAKIQCWNFDRRDSWRRSIKAEDRQSLRPKRWGDLVLGLSTCWHPRHKHGRKKRSKVQRDFRFPLYYSPFFSPWAHRRRYAYNHGKSWRNLYRVGLGTLSPTNGNCFNRWIFGIGLEKELRNGKLSATKKDKTAIHRFVCDWKNFFGRPWEFPHRLGMFPFYCLAPQRQKLDG